MTDTHVEPERSPALDPRLAREALGAAAVLAAEYLDQLPTRRVAPSPADVEAALEALGGDLPTASSGPLEILERLATYGGPATTATAGGRFFGLVVGSSAPAALGARILSSAWDQVVFNDATSAIGCALERVAIRWVKELLSLPPEAQGVMVTRHRWMRPRADVSGAQGGGDAGAVGGDAVAPHVSTWFP